VAEGLEPRWLLLIHQIPPRPAYLRVKIGRRLQGLGAVAVKNSVYVLPRSDQSLEDFQWVRSEILGGGGDASVCEARFVEGLSDAGVEALFNGARATDYAELIREARRLRQEIERRPRATARREQQAGSLLRLRKRFDETVALDFFGASGREALEETLVAVEACLKPASASPGSPARPTDEVRGRTWVTRRGVQVDRIASAWLIRRFIDPEARFKFVGGHDYAPEEGELRFDMFEAEFTHEGEACTFEVLTRRFGFAKPGIRALAEIVHDLDLKDARFKRPEAAGLERLLAGIALRNAADEDRLREGALVFDALFASFERKR
jgi:hypothetical protein